MKSHESVGYQQSNPQWDLWYELNDMQMLGVAFNRRKCVCFCAASLLVAVPGTFGVFYEPLTGGFKVSTPMLIGFSMAWAFLAFVSLHIVDCFALSIKNAAYTNLDLKENPNQRRRVIGLSFLFFSAWLPYLVIQFPGPMCWDTYTQIAQNLPEKLPFLANPRMSIVVEGYYDHHPVFDSILYGIFVIPSERLFGDWSPGIFVFGLIQSSAFSITCSYIVCFIDKLAGAKWLTFLAIVFYCTCPIVAAHAGMMLKDVTFSLLFMWWLVLLVKIAMDVKVDNSARDVVLFVILSLILPLTKKLGLAIVVPTLILFPLIVRHAKKAMYVSCVATCVVSFLIVPLVIFPSLSVLPGGKQEALSTLFQQTARFVKYHPDAVTATDREIIDKILEYDTLASRYNPIDSNAVKNGFDYYASLDDIFKYLQVWLRQGLSDPVLYCKSIWSTCYGFYSPTYGFTAFIAPMVSDEARGIDSSDLRQPDSLAAVRNDLYDSYNATITTRGLSLFMTIVMYSWWIPVISVFFALRRGSKEALALLLPVIFSSMSCILSFEPSIGRYVIHLVYCVPIIAYIAFYYRDSTQFSGNCNNKDGVVLSKETLC